MYKYTGIRKLEEDIFTTKAQVLKTPISGIDINSIKVVIAEDEFQILQKDIKERMTAIQEARGEATNPEINEATINHLKFADIHVYFERLAIEDADLQY